MPGRHTGLVPGVKEGTPEVKVWDSHIVFPLMSWPLQGTNKWNIFWFGWEKEKTTTRTVFLLGDAPIFRIRRDALHDMIF